MKYNYKRSVLVVLSLLAVYSCANNVEEVSKLDTVDSPPIVNNPVLQFSNLIKETGDFTISWVGAEDDKTAFNDLQYQLYYSDFNNIASKEAIIANGSAFTPYSNEKTIVINGLADQLDKYWNVLVKDKKSNLVSYQSSLPILGLGKLDESFSELGRIVQEYEPNVEFWNAANDITMDKDGNLLVTGYQHNGTDEDMIVWKYKRGVLGRWELDKSFDAENKGYIIHHNAAGGNGKDIGAVLRVTEDGHIYVVGYSFKSNNLKLVIWSIAKGQNGYWELDKSFDELGLGYLVEDTVSGFSDTTSPIYDMILDSMGRIIVSGIVSIPGKTGNFMTVWRFAKGLNGKWSLDNKFDPDGFGYISYNQQSASAYGLTLDEQGRILVVGCIQGVLSGDMAIWRINNYRTGVSDFDNTFSVEGTALITYPYEIGDGGGDCGGDVTVSVNGDILITGSRYNALFHYDMVVWRYTRSKFGYMESDLTFNSNGEGLYVFDDFQDIDSGGSAIISDRNGGIIIAGGGFNGTQNGAMLWRLAPSANSQWDLDKSFGPEGNGYVSESQIKAASSYSNFIIDDQGRIVTVGGAYYYDNLRRNMHISRFR